MDKNTTPKHFNTHGQKAVLRDPVKRRVVSPVRQDVSENSFLVGSDVRRVVKFRVKDVRKWKGSKGTC